MKPSENGFAFFDVYVVPWAHFEWGLKSGLSVLIVALFAALICLIPVHRIAKQRNELSTIAGALIVMAIFGGLLGYHGGNSRVGVVGEVLPAVLALVAGLAAYLFGVPGKQAGPYMFPLLGAMVITVFVTWGMGASNNSANADTNAYVARCFEIYQAALETPDGFQLLDDKLKDYCDYAFDLEDTNGA